jgi:hypothetical protein
MPLFPFTVYIAFSGSNGCWQVPVRIEAFHAQDAAWRRLRMLDKPSDGYTSVLVVDGARASVFDIVIPPGTPTVVKRQCDAGR